MKELAAVHLPLGDQLVDEGHLEGVVAVDELDLFREQRGAVGIVRIREGEHERGAGNAFRRQGNEAAVGRRHRHQVLVILAAADLPDEQGSVRNDFSVGVLRQVQHVLASQTAEGEGTGLAVVQDGDVLACDLGGGDIKGGVHGAVQLPRNALEPTFRFAGLVEGLGLDAEDVLIDSKDDAVVFVFGRRLAGSRVDESGRNIVHEVEILRLQSLQGTGIGNGNLDGVRLQAVVAHDGAQFDLLHLGRRPGAARCGEQGGPKDHSSAHDA